MSKKLSDMFKDFEKSEKKPVQEAKIKKVISEPEKIKIAPKIALKQQLNKESKQDINASLELNLIKSLYANRFGSTTNKSKAHMIRMIKNAWKY